MFNVEKLIQICNYMVKKNDYSLNYTKLIKMLYIADKEALKSSIQTITGDSYVSMDNGPVLSKLYDLIMGKYRKGDAQSLWNSRFIRDGYNLIAAIEKIPHSELSSFEMQTLDQIYNHFEKYSLGQLIDYVHKFPEWKDPSGSSIPIMPQEILESVGRTNEEIEWILAETNAFEEEEQAFLSLAAQ